MTTIYKIKSPSGKVYIGQTWNYKKRMSGYKNMSCKRQPKLYNSFIKYSIDNHSFTIVHELPKDVTQEILDTYEQFYIDQYKSCGIELMNVREAGSHGKHSAESIEKIKSINKGRKHSEETRKKMSDRMRGNTIRLGKSMSEETKLKMGKSQKGRTHSAETKLKMSMSAKRWRSNQEIDLEN